MFVVLAYIYVVVVLVVVVFRSIYYLCILFRLNTITFSDDSNLICGGFENSSLRIWTLTPRKLRALKPAVELARIDKDAGIEMFTLELNLNVYTRTYLI